MSAVQTPEERVLDAIAAAPLHDGQIAARTGLQRAAVRRALERLCDAGRAEVAGEFRLLNLSKPLWGVRK